MFAVICVIMFSKKSRTGSDFFRAATTTPNTTATAASIAPNGVAINALLAVVALCIPCVNPENPGITLSNAD